MDISNINLNYRLNYYPREYYKIIDMAGNILMLDNHNNIITDLAVENNYYSQEKASIPEKQKE